MKDALLEEYAPKLQELLPLARKAYGSRDTISPQHEASREYTRLVVEYYAKGGSLLSLAKEIGVTYAGLRRRVITDELPANTIRRRSKASPEQVELAVTRIKEAKLAGTETYHTQIRYEYEREGVSLAKIAKGLGLSSANPLYYAVARDRLRESEIA